MKLNVTSQNDERDVTLCTNMNKSGDLGSLPGQLTSITKKTADQFRNEPIEAIETVEAQVGTKPPPQSTATPQDKKGADTSGASDSKDIKDIDPKKATFDVVKELYKQSESKLNIPSDEIIEREVEKNPKKTPEEIQKLLATRQQLLQQQHMTSYFEPTFNPPKKKEPRLAEQVEEEEKEKKQMEALELQKEEEKKEELSPTVKQGTHEINPGVAG